MLPTRRSTWMNRADFLPVQSCFLSIRKIKNDYFAFFLYRHRFGNQKPFTILEARLRIAERKVEDVQTSRRRRENNFLVGERKETYFSLRLLNTPCSRTFFLQSPIRTADTTWAKENIQRMYMIQRFESIYFRLCFASSQVFLLNDLTIKLERKDSQHANEVSLSSKPSDANEKCKALGMNLEISGKKVYKHDLVLRRRSRLHSIDCQRRWSRLLRNANVFVLLKRFVWSVFRNYGGYTFCNSVVHLKYKSDGKSRCTNEHFPESSIQKILFVKFSPKLLSRNFHKNCFLENFTEIARKL